jgi:hypothetical protein
MPQLWASKLFLLVLAGVICCHPFSAVAQDTDDDESQLDLFDEDVEQNQTGWPLLSFSAGVAYLDADGVLGARPPNSPPITIINFDRIGLDESDSSYWLSLTWRSRKSRWGAWFASWSYDVAGERSWDHEWEVSDGLTIPVGARVVSAFDADWYLAELTYSFVQTDKVDAGVGIGVHAVDLDTELTAQIEVGDGRVEIIQGDLNTLAPLPNLVAFASWQILPKWGAIVRVGWFGLDYDIYSGTMANAHFMLNYQATPRFTLGAAYQFVRLDVDIERKHYEEIYDIDFEGPMIFGRFRF